MSPKKTRYHQYTEADRITFLHRCMTNGGNAKGTAKACQIPESTGARWWKEWKTSGEVALPAVPDQLAEYVAEAPPDWKEVNEKLSIGFQSAAAKALRIIHEGLDHINPRDLSAKNVSELVGALDRLTNRYLDLSQGRAGSYHDNRTNILALPAGTTLQELIALRDDLTKKLPTHVPDSG